MRRLVVERDLRIRVSASTERREVLANSDAVTATIAVGGLEAWRVDVDVPARYGCIQPVGDTAGPGGLGRGLRHIPELVAIAEDMADLCPSALLCNYTNPMTALTRAVVKHTPVKCVGLCIGPELTWRHLSSFLDLPMEETTAHIAGINHCHWVLQFSRNGEDLFPRVASRLAELRAEAVASGGDDSARATDPFAGAPQPLSFGLWEHFGCYPGPGDSHVSEFFPQFIHGPGRAAELGLKDGNACTRSCREHPERFEQMRQQAFGEAPLDEEMFGEDNAYGEESQLKAILTGLRDERPVSMWANVTNNGTISNLPGEVVVEVPCTVTPAGVQPVPVGPLPSCVAAPLARTSENLEVLIDAALAGSREQAVQAYLNDPYCADFVTAPELVNELIDTLLPWLPKFRGSAA
jgi:alpha-galactosidase